MNNLFKNTAIILFALMLPLTFMGRGFAQSLNNQSFDDIARVISPSLAQSNRLTARATFSEISARMLPEPESPLKQIDKWHQITLAALAADHIPEYDQNGAKITLQQFGPHRASYVAAMVHLAIFEVANAYSDKYQGWIENNLPDVIKGNLIKPPSNSAEDAAIEAAAHDMLVHLYKNFSTELDSALTYKSCDNKSADIKAGCTFGRQIAALLVLLRSSDKASTPEPEFGITFFPKAGRNADGSFPDGQWSPDPVSKINVALGGNWGTVTPFFSDVDANGQDVAKSLSGPPKFSSNEYMSAFRQVRDEGEDRTRRAGASTPSRDENYHYYVGKFWSYDGTPSLCAPVRLYNEIADKVLKTYATDIAPKMSNPKDVEGSVDVARYYAVANLAMVDAGIEAWKAKYNYQYWRPITGIRAEQAKADSARLPTPTPERPFPHQPFPEIWYPLGAQNTNSSAGYNITPPFPAYPSGHAVFGSAFFEVLRHFVANDKGFELTSDELNPELSNVDEYNFTRCVDGDKNPFFCKGVKFTSFANAESCNSKSRVWLGVHWGFDATDGERLGRAIGKAAWRQLLPKNASQAGPDVDTPIGACPTPAEFIADVK